MYPQLPITKMNRGEQRDCRLPDEAKAAFRRVWDMRQ
jgi:hypothetical protein